MASLHPKRGARVVLEHDSVDEATPRYRVTVYEPDEVSHRATARLAPRVEIGEWTTKPPDWAGLFVRRLLDTLAKKHASADSKGTWPRKVTRWRDVR